MSEQLNTEAELKAYRRNIALKLLIQALNARDDIEPEQKEAIKAFIIKEYNFKEQDNG